jgi:processive 1,2-diacylglycerol beta-glucosyltransferase
MARILLLYISEHSGHHRASIAIENALRHLAPGVKILDINSFNYTNPILEKIINRAYMEVIKNKPEIWDYLYDNPRVLRKTQKLRDMIHRFNSGKLKTLLDEFRPDAIVCTQAFPCGMVADYKKSNGSEFQIFAVLTDYAPHSYWIYNSVDVYIVPSDEAGQKLVNDGIDPSRIKAFGIPIDPKFRKKADRNAILEKLGLHKNKKCVLVMGGTQGLGPVKEIVRALDSSSVDMQIIVATGTNKKLFRYLSSRHFRKKVLGLYMADNIEDLMAVSDLIITKPGGITTAEALAKGLPMLIVNPLPGQESMNTKFLLSEGVAVKAEHPLDACAMLEELLYNDNKLKDMRDRALSLSRPESSINIAKLILGQTEK